MGNQSHRQNAKTTKKVVEKNRKRKSVFFCEIMVFIFAQFWALREFARKFVPAKICTIKVDECWRVYYTFTDECFVCTLLMSRLETLYKVANPPRYCSQVLGDQCTDICQTLSWTFTGVQIF